MAKKVRARIFCKICNRPTTHEPRNVDDKEIYVCLLCEARPEQGPKGQDDFKYMDRVVNAERMRIWSNMPRGF